MRFNGKDFIKTMVLTIGMAFFAWVFVSFLQVNAYNKDPDVRAPEMPYNAFTIFVELMESSQKNR